MYVCTHTISKVVGDLKKMQNYYLNLSEYVYIFIAPPPKKIYRERVHKMIIKN